MTPPPVYEVPPLTSTLKTTMIHDRMPQKLLSGLTALLLVAACHAETFTSPGIQGFEVVQGVPDTVSLGTEVDPELLLRVVDDVGRPRAAVRVHWSVAEGDGELIPLDTLTSADGLVAARWKFGYLPGPQRIRVAVDGVAPLYLSTNARGFEAIQVTAGFGFGCGLDADRRAWCWSGDSLELGDPAAGHYTLRPTRVTGVPALAEIRAGDSFACGRTDAGAVWCWGYNWGSAIALAPVIGFATPIQIAGLPPMTQLRTGAMHSCGLAADSTAWCWGNNSDGQAGSGPSVVPPTQIGGALRFVELAPGYSHTCARTALGEAECWGANGSGQLGDSGAMRATPTGPVSGGHLFAQIGSGDHGTCGRTTEGEIWCWGLTLRATTYGPHPTLMQLPPARGFANAFGYVAAISLGGTVTFADLGHGPQTLPAEIAQQGVSQIAGRGSYCLLSRTGVVYCSASIVDQGSCSALPPAGCVPGPGPIPLPTGGRLYEPLPSRD